MFITKRTHNAVVVQKDAEIAAHKLAKKAALKDLADTVADRDHKRESLDIALRQNAHLQAEVAQLTRDIAGLLPDAEAHRARKARQMKNLRQFKGKLAEAA